LFGLDFSASTVSLLVGILFAGVILSQMPVAWLADRLGRFSVLLGCHALLLISLFVVWFNPNAAFLAIALFFLGTCCGALYPLGLALLGDRLPRAALARANARYLASNCAGSLSGPILFGLVIDQFGQSAQFLAGIMAVTFVLGLWLISRRAQVKREVRMDAPMQSGTRKAG
jgi:MFS family permease